MHRFLPAALAAVALAFGPAPVAAQGDGEPQALGLHEKAQTKFQELHRRMQALQSAKQATEPEQSRLLQRGNHLIQERRIHDGMERSRELIADGLYDEALETMQAVGKDLADLLSVLLDRELELEELMDRIKTLEQFRDRVDRLLDDQQAEKDQAAKSESLLDQLERIAKAKADVERLMAEQSQLRDAANESGMQAEPSAAQAMSAKQAELEKRAADLAEQLDRIEAEAEKTDDGDPSLDDGKPGDSGGSASSSCEGASKSMQGAKQKLDQNRPESSLDDMDKAMSELEKTKRELEEMAEEARRKLEQLPFDQQRRNQERTRVDTDALAKDMESAEQSEGSDGGEPTPGKENVQQAVPKQKAAAGQLKEKDPSKAKQEQQDASEDLEKAKQELEDALAQLRQQLEDEVLRALEERFGEMLARQKEISARTRAIDELRRSSTTAAGAVPAKVRNTCRDLSVGEGELAGEASDALKLLEEDGRSTAFPMIVEDLRDDLGRVSDRLAESDCAATTQDVQADIEATLNDLLNALRKTIDERAGGT